MITIKGVQEGVIRELENRIKQAKSEAENYGALVEQYAIRRDEEAVFVREATAVLDELKVKFGVPSE